MLSSGKDLIKVNRGKAKYTVISNNSSLGHSAQDLDGGKNVVGDFQGGIFECK